MRQFRNASNRGATDLGWLDSRHSFAFGRGFPAEGEPLAMGFRNLRVINDDRVLGGGGFGTHPHDNMEILSYAVDGALEHKDSMGTTETINAGDFQLTTAGSGITHSEYNPSKTDSMRFIQIWIKPAAHNVQPRYQHLVHDESAAHNTPRLIASPNGADGSMTINADARLWAVTLDAGVSIDRVIPGGRHAWIQVVRGAVRVDDESMSEGDGLAISDEEAFTITATSGAELLIFDLA